MWGFKMSPIFRQKSSTRSELPGSQYVRISTYCAMFSEPHCCLLSALLLVDDLPLRSYLLTKSQEPSELFGQFLALTSLGASPRVPGTLSAWPLCWEIVASGFSPTDSELMLGYPPNPVCDGLLWRGHLGSPGGGDSPCLVPQSCTDSTHSPVASTRQANASRQSSKLVQN